MAVVAMSSQINGLTRLQVMPYWYTTAHWHAQYALDVNCPTIESIQEIRASSTKDEQLCYCPLWTATTKKERPKENEHKKSVVNLIAESGKKQKRVKRLFCKICHKFDHNTNDCFKNPAKQLFACALLCSPIKANKPQPRKHTSSCNCLHNEWQDAKANIQPCTSSPCCQ